MEEFNINDLLKYYFKKLPIIILTTILLALLGYSYVKYEQVPMYKSSTTVILVQANNNSDSDTTMRLAINSRLATTYSELIKSRRVLGQVVENLKLNTTAQALAGQITVTSISDTPILKIDVVNSNNKDAARIANELANVFTKEVIQIYNLENISVMDEALVSNYPYNINTSKKVIIFGLIGAVLSCGIIFIMFYFDNTIKNKKEIESKLNLPVLGEIPIATKLTKNSKLKLKKKKHTKKKTTKDNKDNNTLTAEQITEGMNGTPKETAKTKAKSKTTTSKKATATKKTTTTKKASTAKTTRKKTTTADKTKKKEGE